MIRIVSAAGLMAALIFAVGYRFHGAATPATGSSIELMNATQHNAHVSRLTPGATIERSEEGGFRTLPLTDDKEACTRRLVAHLPVSGGEFAIPKDGVWLEYRETYDVSWITKTWAAKSGTIRFDGDKITFDASFEPSAKDGNGAEGRFTLAGAIRGASPGAAATPQ